MNKTLFSSLLLASFSAHTQTNNALELPNMVVTATRTEQATNELAAATTVYTRKDIDRLQVKTLPELLQGTTGVDLTQQGGYGKLTDVFIRGTNSDNVLVLVDGIKVGSVTTGTSSFEFVPIDQIERVEIVRGPNSSLYGSEAIGGVIQIFTRKGSTTGNKPNIVMDAGAGSYDTYRASGTVSGKWKNSWYTLGSSQIGTNGINATQPTPGAYGVDQPDHDGYNNTSVNARLGHRFDNKAEVDAFFMRSQGTTWYDGNYQNKTGFINQVAGLTGSMNILDNWHSTLRLGQSNDYNNNFAPDGSYSSSFYTTRWNATWLNKITLSDHHQLTLGSDYRLDQLNSSEQYSKTSRYDAGVFAELHSQVFDNHFINASVRYDNNQQFGNYVTGNFGWRYNWAHGISVLASFGNAFKAPSFNDLYYPNYGNSSLKPEQSTSFETGLAGNHDWGQWQLRAYHTDIDNLITPVCNSVSYTCIAENIGKAKIEGVESEIGTQIYGWNAKLGADILNPLDKITNLRLPRRADKTLSVDLSRSFGSIDVGAKLLAQDYRYDNPANTIKVAGYATVDLRSAYHFDKNWTVNAKLSNLLDKSYQTSNNYNSLGRNFFFSIHYNY